MRRIIAIIDPDTEYAQKLALYINKHDFGGLRAVAFSGAGSFKELCGGYDTRVMLIDENEVGSMHDAEGRYLTVCLSEDSFAATHYVTINKYSGADTIVRFVLTKYTEISKDVLMRTSINRSHVITVCSPVGRCGKTSFAITAALCLGAESRCLLLSLDEYSGVFRYMVPEARSDLSDVIYAYKKGRYSWTELARTVCRFGTADLIAPVRYPEDLMVLNGEQMTDMLDRIAVESGYDNIIIDVGSYGKRAAEILEMSNEIFMPVLEDGAADCKTEEFLEVLRQSGRSDIIGRIRQIKLPREDRPEGLMKREEEYCYGKLFEFTRDIFADSGEAERKADGHEGSQ